MALAEKIKDITQVQMVLVFAVAPLKPQFPVIFTAMHDAFRGWEFLRNQYKLGDTDDQSLDHKFRQYQRSTNVLGIKLGEIKAQLTECGKLHFSISLNQKHNSYQ